MRRWVKSGTRKNSGTGQLWTSLRPSVRFARTVLELADCTTADCRSEHERMCIDPGQITGVDRGVSIQDFVGYLDDIVADVKGYGKDKSSWSNIHVAAAADADQDYTDNTGNISSHFRQNPRREVRRKTLLSFRKSRSPGRIVLPAEVTSSLPMQADAGVTES